MTLPHCSTGEPHMLELCCGTARLTKAFIDAGIPALGVDCVRNRHRAVAPWTTVDLTDSGAVDSLLGLMASCQSLQLVWMRLPRGTASRAREIQWKPGLPKPLRSPQEPLGHYN